MKIEFEIPDKTMEKYTKPLSMWHHWRSSMSLSMIIWAILKLSAPTIIGWTLLWVFFGIATTIMIILGLIKRHCEKKFYDGKKISLEELMHDGGYRG